MHAPSVQRHVASTIDAGATGGAYHPRRNSLAARLIDVVGPARARQLLLSGAQLPAERALEVGLVDDVVPAPELQERVEQQIAVLLANAPQAMTWIKRAVDFAVRHPNGEPFTFDVLGTQVFATRDCAEGVTSFLARRPPTFTGD